jgi:hypothetical protein
MPYLKENRKFTLFSTVLARFGQKCGTEDVQGYLNNFYFLEHPRKQKTLFMFRSKFSHFHDFG